MKKVLIIGGGALFVIVLIAVVLFFFQKQNNPSSQTNTTTTQQVFDFQMTYPSDWSGNFTTQSPGIPIFFIKPTASGIHDIVPIMIVEKHLASKSDEVEKNRSEFLGLAHTISKAQINDKEVEVITSLFSPAPYFKNVPPKVQVGFVEYPYKDAIYLFKYKYADSKVNVAQENFYKNILSSIKFP